MGFFQNSVINKHLKALDKVVVNAAYTKFKQYFHNPEIQHNIREAKEEQFQEGFLRELFVKILGYTLNPQPNYNLTTELKNEKGAKKADGAILKEGKALAVIELKGTDTKDLDKINTQAFNYKNNQTGCIYVITSNFEKLRFFIHNSVDHLEFNLFTLTEQEFELLWLCLNVDCLLGGIPLKVKEESLLAEENVTKQLYKDYATFRIDLWQNMVKNRPDTDQLILFKKTQKLLDRFLFIFFAEDSGLLPPNSISRIVKRWKVLQEEDAYKPLYNIFNQYFGYINTGRKGKIPQDDIFAYNGGLFFSDEVLDNIVIDDDVLHPHVMKLTAYDFQTEIDVNILGHIFENSLSEIENVIAKLEGKEVDKNKTKRKKEGIFYTPKYITKYIVDNTVGKLCEEKKAELGIVDEEYAKGRRNRKKVTIKKLDNNLQAYRKWLLNITICDPACGSGAFLNQALEHLIAEHAYIDELQAQLLGRSIVFQDVSNHILENNIYGVDINEESVDIAKLSLWLRTAQKGRRLTTLNNNLKCGNSLIDDPEVACDKAFIWQKEFPEIFAKGGFDVVIGNPPYVGIQGIEWDYRRYYETIYTTATGRFDLYTLFIEKAMHLKRRGGSFSFIVPGKILNNKQFKEARKIICNNHSVIVLKLDDKVFDEAQVDSVVLLNHWKGNNKDSKYRAYNLNIDNAVLLSETSVSDILKDPENIFRLEINETFDQLIQKIQRNTLSVKQIAKVKDGIVAGTIKDILFLTKKENDNCKKLYFGKNLARYYLGETDVWVNYKPDEMMAEEVRRKNGKRAGLWMRDEKIFLREKILTRFVGKEIIGYFDNQNIYYEHTLHSTHIFDKRINHKYLLGLYNSKLINFYYKKTNSKGGNIFPQVRISSVENLPIKIADDSTQNRIIEKVEFITTNTNDFKKILDQFSILLQSKFDIDKLSKKLQHWQKIEFKDFLKELKKSKVRLSLSEESEWLQYFDEQKEKAQTLKTEIAKTDKEIDQMVYELYGLSKEEIEIIEQST